MSISRSVRNSLWMGLGYFIALELMIVAAILFWPSFEGNTGALKVLAAPIPMLRDMFERDAKWFKEYALVFTTPESLDPTIAEAMRQIQAEYNSGQASWSDLMDICESCSQTRLQAMEILESQE